MKKIFITESAVGNNLSDTNLKKITKIYEGKIKLPKEIPAKQILLCPIGLVGAGKTTVVKPISKKLHLLRISGDEIRHVLRDNGFNYLRTLEIGQLLIKKYINKKYSVTIDSDCIASEVRNFIKKITKEKNLKTFWIHVKPPEKYIINKLKSFGKTWLFDSGLQAIKVYKRRKPLHKEYLKLIKFDYTFDTSKENLKEQINKFINIVKNV